MSYDSQDRRSEERRIGDLEQMVDAHSTRLTIIETQRGSLADREWVHDIVRPMETTMLEMKHSIDGVSVQIAKFLELQAKRNDEQGFWSVISNKWQPILAIVGGVAAIIASLGAFAGWYLHMLGVIK